MCEEHEQYISKKDLFKTDYPKLAVHEILTLLNPINLQQSMWHPGLSNN